MQVETWPVSRLNPYEGNARVHPDWQVAQIAASIAEFGFCNPILVGSDDVIVAGHGRLMAAQHLGLAEVPVIVLDHLSPTQRRALVIADNKIGENAGWDEDKLARELAALRAESYDLEVTGFTETEIAHLLAGIDGDDGAPPPLGDPESVPPVPSHPVSAPGDVWVLGHHRVMCGDATDAAQVATLCDGIEVDACWTDPPYNVDYEGTAGKILNDAMDATSFRRFLTAAFSAAASVLKAGGPIYVAHAPTEGYAFSGAFRDAGFKLSGCLVWVKPSLVLGRSDYQWRHEPILYGWKPGAAHSWHGGRNKTTVIEDARAPLRVMPDGTIQIDLGGQVAVIRGEGLLVETLDESVLRFDKPSRNAEHPTMKPVSLVLWNIENSTQPGDVVLDPFGGSGSTLIACHGSSRAARLMELDPRFVDVIVRRWQEYASGEAVLEATGQTFDQVAAQREAA